MPTETQNHDQSLLPYPEGNEKHRFSTMTASLLEMGDYLEHEQVELVVMEATGIYWRAVYYSLESRNMKVHLVNRSSGSTRGAKPAVSGGSERVKPVRAG